MIKCELVIVRFGVQFQYWLNVVVLFGKRFTAILERTPIAFSLMTSSIFNTAASPEFGEKWRSLFTFFQATMRAPGLTSDRRPHITDTDEAILFAAK